MDLWQDGVDNHIRAMGFGQLARIRENPVVTHFTGPSRHSIENWGLPNTKWKY